MGVERGGLAAMIQGGCHPDGGGLPWAAGVWGLSCVSGSWALTVYSRVLGLGLKLHTAARGAEDDHSRKPVTPDARSPG